MPRKTALDADGNAVPKPKATRKRNSPRAKHDAARIASVAKQAEALEYRKLGLSYAQIGLKLGMSAQGAWNAVDSALKRTLDEADAGGVRKLELARLDALWLGFYAVAQKGDVQALGGCMNIMNRRARLLGLDAPEKREVTGADGTPLLPAVPPSLSFVLTAPAVNEAVVNEAAAAG